jgi:multiple antibiotic resistance protein
MDAMLLFLTSLFTVMNPLGVVPLFISFTEGLDAATIRSVALRASFTAFAALVIFALAGEAIFAFFGISVNGLKVVGGVLFFFMGYEMLRGITVPKKLDSATESDFSAEVAITPLAIPMIAGPGAITMVILFMRDAGTLLERALVVASIGAVCVATALILLGGRRIIGLLGPSGAKVMMRIMGLIVMLIAVEFFFSGITPYVQAMLEGGPAAA